MLTSRGFRFLDVGVEREGGGQQNGRARAGTVSSEGDGMGTMFYSILSWEAKRQALLSCLEYSC